MPDTRITHPDDLGPRRGSEVDWDDDAEFEEIHAPSATGRRVLLLVLGVMLLFAIAAGGALVWAMGQIDPGDPGSQIQVTISKGSGVTAIAQLLEKKGVITSARVFTWYAKWQGKGTAWKAGVYANFHRNSAMGDVVDVLDKGPVPPQAASLTIVPGTTIGEQLAAIAKAFPAITVNELQAALDGGAVTSKYLPPGSKNWEGLLAADTFQFEKQATAQKILQTLADQQVKVLDLLGYARAQALSGHSAYELITIASLAEREAGTPPDERGKVVRVILNRLEKKTPLGIDASIMYGLGKTTGALTASDLKKDTPYNNRIHPGLPPTPIATPSKAALQAAIKPPDGPWIYYVLVSKDPPSHLFTDSFAEFNQAKADAKAKGIF